MKILCFAEFFPPYIGSDFRIYKMMRNISINHSVSFAIFPPIRFLRGMLSREKHEEIIGKIENKKENKDGINVHYIKLPYLIERFWKLNLSMGIITSSVYLLFKSIRLLKQNNIDIVVLNYPSIYTGLIGLLSAKISGKPVVLDFNDLIAQYAAERFDIPKKSLAIKFFIFIQNKIAYFSDAVIVITSYIKEYCIKIGIESKKIEVIPNGVDFNIFSRSERKEPHKIKKNSITCVYAGLIESCTGKDIILNMAVLRKDINFNLIGNTDSLGLIPENINLIGYLTHEKIPSFLHDADYILVPFPDNEVSHAASPIKLFEGLASGTPVIASHVSGICDIIRNGENGMLANPDDPYDWIRKIDELEKNPEKYYYTSKNAVITAKHYDWKILSKNFEKIIVRVCRENPPHKLSESS